MLAELSARIGLREVALGVFAVSGVAILAALGYEHIGGYEPCELCLRQRWAYYLGIPVALLAALLAHARPGLSATLIGAVGVGFVLNAGLGVHHAGVEWGWWAGPSGCSGGVNVSSDAGALLESLRGAEVVRCDEPAFRFLGLSFAGWNVVTSLAIACLAAFGALRHGADMRATA